MQSIAGPLAVILAAAVPEPVIVLPTGPAFDGDIGDGDHEVHAGVDLAHILHTGGDTYMQAHALQRAPRDEARLNLLAAPTRNPSELRPVPAARYPPASYQATLPDPRNDPDWLARDQRLTKGMLATGILLGVTTLGIVSAAVSSAALYRQDPDPNAVPVIDGYAALVPLFYVAIVAVAAIPFTVVGAARTKHRRPLRNFRAGVAGYGLQLSF